MTLVSGMCEMILPPLLFSLFNAFRKRYGCLMPTHCSMIWFDVSNLLLGLNNELLVGTVLYLKISASFRVCYKT